MYFPPDGSAFEFVELHNAGSATLDLSGFRFSGIDFQFPPAFTLAPDRRLVLIPNDDPKAFTNRFPTVTVTGFYGGKLANEGETLSLFDANGRLVTRVSYAPAGFWPAATAGHGASLEFVGPANTPADPANWRPSPAPGGSPGNAPAPANQAEGELNELGWDNHGAAFFECTALATTELGFAGWSLSDDNAQPRKWPIDTSPPLGTLQSVALTAGAGLPIEAGPALDRLIQTGGTLALYDPTGLRQDCVSFGPIPRNLALGRIGQRWAPVTPTPGLENQATTTANVEALRLNEWSANANPGETDWIEVHNTDPALPLALEEMLLAVDADILQPPPNRILEPGGFLVLPFNPDPDPRHVQHRLPASGAQLRLLRRNGSTLHALDYGPQLEGSSEGLVPDGGTQVVRFLQLPTPGGSNHRDTDGDSFPDAWETAHGLDPLTAEDPTRDSDADGAPDVDEWRAGTDAAAPASRLILSARQETGTVAGSRLRLEFHPAPRRSYSILRRTTLMSPWAKLEDLFVDAATGPVVVHTDPGPNSQAYFTVVTPAQRLPGETPIVAINPPDRAEGVPHSVTPALVWRSPLPPWPPTQALLQVLETTGHPRTGHIEIGADARLIHLRLDTPLPASTRFQLAYASPTTQDGDTASSNLIVTTFTTAPSVAARDLPSAYTNDPVEVLKLAVVTRPFPGGWTLDDVNAGTSPPAALEPRVPIQFAPEPGSSVRTGSLRQRGQSSRESNQKSYRIEIAADSPTWRGLRVLNLNKHPYDLTRLRNRLSFDLLRLLPDLLGLRSLFVQLEVDGVNLGLFTLIEQPGRTWLESRGLDPQAHLYKAVMFEFQRDSAILRNDTDPAYDRARFETRLEIFGAAHHSKLLEMLDALNDPNRPIDSVIASYFHRDNYLDWLASAVLLDNKDTSSQNFLLYSPSDASTWHFVPWDYDGAWGFYDQPDQRSARTQPRWREGIANWWGATLHRRFLSETHNLDDLRLRIQTLADTLFTPTTISNRVLALSRTIRPHLLEAPDLHELPLSMDQPAATQVDLETQRLTHLVESNRLTFETTLDRPMPVFLGAPESTGPSTQFRWTPSFHLLGHPITYDLQIARTPDFDPASWVHETRGLTNTTYSLTQSLPPGRLFWRVLIRDTQTAAWQIPFDSYTDPATGTPYHGVLPFHANP